ncbi:MAG: UDP-3-O-(3-hydroxymyristoyl)glucosamine N-acyltransferase [Betaproteobacteria bacterium]|nr:UDP-3-O-(3-hydroxymyristoyl)glucosamine N-acyltransferase [Betaproteobacteria bacterium]
MDASSQAHVTAQELVDRFGGRIDGDPSIGIWRFMSLATAETGDASFLAHPRYQKQLNNTSASIIVLSDAQLARERGLTCTLVVTDDPYLFFAKAASWLSARACEAHPRDKRVHTSACVDPSAHLGSGVSIGAQAVIESGVIVDDEVEIGPGCIIGSGTRIGRGSRLLARVTICSGSSIGERVLIQSGAVIGSDGFGLVARPDRSWMKVPQLGFVTIGNDVEIGANTTIDRGTLDATIIEDGVKLDNLIQIAHNVRIGRHTAVAACVGIAGSAQIGAYCQIGGAAGILGHLEIPDFTTIGPMSLVMSSIDRAGKYVGVYPLQEQRAWEKSAVLVRRLSRFRRQLKQTGDQDT